MCMATAPSVMASHKRSTKSPRVLGPVAAAVCSHRLAEARSLAMHAVIAAKIEREPALLGVARKNLKRWRARWRGDVPAWHCEWCKILERPWTEIATLMTEQSEDGVRLRQSSPFAGVLSVAERRRVYSAFQLDEAGSATRRSAWRRENAKAIAGYNDLVATQPELSSRRR